MTARRFSPPRDYDSVYGTRPPTPEPERNGAVRKRSKRKPSKAAAESIGRFQDHTKFLRESARLCNTTEQAVWFALWDRCYGGKTEAVSQKQLADYLGVTTRTIKTALKSLKAKGLISVHQRGHSGGFASIYIVRPIPEGRDHDR